MEDEDLPELVVRGRDIAFGSLEGQADQLRHEAAEPAAETGPRLEVGTLSDASHAMMAERRAAEKIIQDDRHKRDVERYLPVLDPDVRRKLRTLGEPVTLFGEGPYDRRLRLRSLLAERLAAGETLQQIRVEAPTATPEQQERFYSEGPPQLRQARLDICAWSLPRAKARLQQQQEEQAAAAALTPEQHTEASESWRAELRKFMNVSSGVPRGGPARPLSACKISPSGDHVLVSSWNEAAYLYKIPDMCPASEDGPYISAYGGHTSRVTGCAFHPGSMVSQPAEALNFATSSADKTVRLWSLKQDASIATLAGHTEKVNKLAFHPSGDYVASTSDDRTFRLWDVQGGKAAMSLTEQEGHAAPVYGVAFQCDGAIVATSDTWGVGRVWDLRTGRSLFVLEGHAKDVLGLAFSPNGWLLCTGGADNLLKVWDLRRRECLATLPAHSRLVTSVAFEPTTGSVLSASSHDNTVTLYDTTSFKLVKTLKGHENRVMGVDVGPGAENIVSCGYDGSFKLWQKSAGTDNFDLDAALAGVTVDSAMKQAPDTAQPSGADAADDDSMSLGSAA